MRSPEAKTQTIPSSESHRHSIGETPLFEQLKLEYLKNQGDSDIEPVVSKNGAAISMLLEGAGSESARDTYKEIWATVPDGLNESDVQVYLEQSYQIAKNEDATFLRPAAIYALDNKTVWNASAQKGTTGLALVSDNDSIRLGSEATTGVIEGPLPDGYKLVIADNTLFDQLDQNKALTLENVTRLDDNGERDLYPFYSAVVMDNDNLYARDKKPKHRMDAGQRDALTRTVIDRKVRARTDLGLPLTATDEEVIAARKARKKQSKSDDNLDMMKVIADDAELQAEISAARKLEQTADGAHGFSEMVHLAERVAKYDEKVAAYEDIAAKALAKRMKGRLFKPLTRKGKENAKTDDLNMHLLEGFSRALDGAMMKQWLAEGYSDDEAAQMLYEHQQTRQEARAARNREEFRKDKLGSFLDKYANMSKGKKIGVTIGAAAVFGTIGLVAGAAGGAAAAVGGIGLAGVKVGKTYLQHRSKIYEAGKDESMTPPDRPISIANGQATKRTAAQQVFAGMEHDEKKREKAIQKSDRNKKVAAGLAAAAGILIGAGVVTKIAEHSDDIRDYFSKPLPHDTSAGPDADAGGTGDRIVDPPVDTAAEKAREIAAQHAEILHSSTQIIPDGGGGEAYTIANGANPSTWYNNQNEFLRLFPDQAYRMPDGNVGFARPGELSDAAKEYWAKKFGKWL